MHHWSEAAYIMQTPEGPVGIYWEESDDGHNTGYPKPIELKSIYEHLERDYLAFATEARDHGICCMLEEQSLESPILFARCKAGGLIDWEGMKHPSCNPILGFVLSSTYRTVPEPENYLQLCVWSSNPYGETHEAYWEFDTSNRTWHSLFGDGGFDLFKIVDPSKLPQGHRLQAEFTTPIRFKGENGGA